MWLRKKIETLLTVNDWEKTVLGNGRVLRAHKGRKARFVAVMMGQHGRWFLAMLFLFIESVLAFANGYDELFSRLGAVTALIGVLFGMYCVRQIQTKIDSEVYSALMRASAQIADTVAHQRVDDPRLALGTIPSGVSGQIPAVVRDLLKQASERTRFYYRCEIFFASIGTLQWAFGDWLVCRFTDCVGATSC